LIQKNVDPEQSWILESSFDDDDNNKGGNTGDLEAAAAAALAVLPAQASRS
jgi:hypothetical protein